MRIGLIGYGKMGRAIESCLDEQKHQVVARIDPTDPLATSSMLTEQAISSCDVCIDYSHPHSVLSNIEIVTACQKPLVVGTTGWHDQERTVKNWVEKAGSGLIYSANFSLGVQLFLQIVANAAKRLQPYPFFDVAGFETHHRQKADSPSGTARQIAEILLKHLPWKSQILYDRPEGKIPHDALHFTSLRVGSDPGSHKVVFDSPSESLELTLHSRSREGYAQGTLLAAEWIIGKQGFFTFEDIISTLV